jgi:hypothetical protein
MGTIIELEIAGIGIDWSKNNPGYDHGSLFQDHDRYRLKMQQRKIRYFSGKDNFGKSAAAFVRPLSKILPRLDMLGHTLVAAKAEYASTLREAGNTFESSSKPKSRYMSFDEFCEFANRWPLEELDANTDFDQNSKTKGRFLALEKEIRRIPMLEWDDSWWSERSYFARKVCILSPYSMLQVFGLNWLNLDAEVVWQYGPLVDSGWANESFFQPGARRAETLLVVTEGSSDSRILKHALNLFRPDTSDFFRFVDVEERHPFWGTGNLVKFAEGLIRIDVQNRVLFVLDNDAEGVDAFRRLQELNMPPNLQAMTLPELQEFKQFPARGPQGITCSDINGQAAAIECYLDLRMPNRPAAHILWSNYKKEVGAWQGALEHKETYMRRFLDQTPITIRENGYDHSKLAMVLDTLVAHAVGVLRVV